MRIPLLLLFLTVSGFAAELNVEAAADKPAALNVRLQSGGSELTGI